MTQPICKILATGFLPEFPPCDPVSELLTANSTSKDPTLAFCAKWNPDFPSHGKQCCAELAPIRRVHSRSHAHTHAHGHRHRNRKGCVLMGHPSRAKASHCDEMTQEQKDYSDAASSGKLGDILNLITQQMGRKGDQAYCTTGNGFLAFGRRVVPSSLNRIIVQQPEKCLNFGTDAMIGMLEWLGREISSGYPAKSYSGVRMILGDITAPKGGRLFNANGHRRHASHTNGQDADVGFLTVRPNQSSPTLFHQQLDLKTNWWFIKKIFKNPFACVKVIFLDQKHIKSLTQFASSDSDWNIYSRFIRHMPGHKNHLHIRVGNGPGQPGCSPNARPELEEEDDNESAEINEQFILDELEIRRDSN